MRLATLTVDFHLIFFHVSAERLAICPIRVKKNEVEVNRTGFEILR